MQCNCVVRYRGRGVKAKDTPRNPPELLVKPTPAQYEVRLIVYSVADVKPDSFIDPLIDMFVKVAVGGSTFQSTDTHFRAENGEAHFNWRMKCDVAPPSARDRYFAVVVETPHADTTSHL